MITFIAPAAPRVKQNELKLCDNMDDFRVKFAKVFKKTAISDQLNFDWARARDKLAAHGCEAATKGDTEAHYPASTES